MVHAATNLMFVDSALCIFWNSYWIWWWLYFAECKMQRMQKTCQPRENVFIHI